MIELFGTKYFGFIATSYAITACVLLAMIVWVVTNYYRHKTTLRRMEQAGLRRASSKNQHG